MIRALPLEASLRWNYPNLGGGPDHTIIANLTGNATLLQLQEKADCTFYLKAILSLGGGRPNATEISVSENGQIGFVGKDLQGRIVWNAPRQSYGLGQQRTIVAVNQDDLKNTARIEVLFSMNKPTLEQRMD